MLVTNWRKWPRTWTDYLDKRSKIRKIYMRFGTWNVRSLYRTDSLMKVLKQILKYKLDLVGVQEIKLDRGGTKSASEYKCFHGQGNENHELRTFIYVRESCYQLRK
jgi:hypothetical protein